MGASGNPDFRASRDDATSRFRDALRVDPNGATRANDISAEADVQ